MKDYQKNIIENCKYFSLLASMFAIASSAIYVGSIMEKKAHREYIEYREQIINDYNLLIQDVEQLRINNLDKNQVEILHKYHHLDDIIQK